MNSVYYTNLVSNKNFYIDIYNGTGPSNEFPSAPNQEIPFIPEAKLHFYPKGHKQTQAHSQKEEIEISVESGPWERAVGKGGKKVWIGC